MKSRDIQQVVMRLHDDSYSNRQISAKRRNTVSSRTVDRWIKMYE